MRLESLVVEKYGNFEREVVRLDATPGRLNLVVAPNGAGKSVLRQAFADLLYGIGGQSRMGFRYGYPGMRLTAELRDGSGGTVRLVRRKGHGGTLLDGEGRDGGALLAGMLGGTDVRRLQQLFSLDTERLRVGGRELLESGGDLAEALLAAGSGLRRARELERGFAEARDALAPERKAAGKPFYQGVEALLEARKSGRAETLTVEAWEEARRGVAEAAEALRLAEAEVAACGAEASRLGRIRATRPLLRQHGEAAGWLAAHGEAPVLGEGLGEALAAAREGVMRAQERVRAAEALLERHEAALAEVLPDVGVLGQAEAVEALVREAATVRQIEGDMPAVAGELAAAERRVAGLRGDLGVSAGVALPGRPVLAQAQALLDRHAGLAAGLVALPEGLCVLAAEREALGVALAALPEGRASGGVEALVREVREGGDPGRGMAAAAAEAAARRGEAGVALALVPGWGADEAAALGALRPELPAGYDRRHQQVLEGGRALDLAVREAGGRREEARAVVAEIEGLVAGEAPVEAEALAAARGHRDRGWDLVAEVAFGSGGLDAEEVRAWAGRASLPVAYVRAVQGADRMADRRVQEAGQLERLVQARLRLAQLGEVVARAEEAVAAARVRAEAARGEWREAVAPLRLGEAAGASEVREVLRLREVALRAVAAAEGAEGGVAAMAALHGGWAERLAGLMGREAGGALPGLLAEAEQAVADGRAQAAERAALGGRLEEVVRRIAQDEARLAGERERFRVWEAEWRGCLAALGRPEGEVPAAVAVVLDLVGQLRGAEEAAEALRERVAGMEARCAGFGGRVAGLAWLEGGGRRPVEVAERLAARLKGAREVQARQAGLRQVCDQASEDRRDAGEALVTAQAALGRAVAVTGAGTVEGAEALLALAGERRRHEGALIEAEARLMEAGVGLALDVLREEAEAVGPDELAVALEAAGARQGAAIAAQSRAAGGWQQRVDALERVLAEDGAARAAAAGAAAVALLGRSLEEALVQHAAGLLLREGLRAVEEGGDNALAARIGGVFAGVTGGRYAGVRVVGAEGKRAARLVAVEEGAGEACEIEDLSEGTRDQLFLALRVAAIEAEVKAGPAPPFLVDDVLQSFDDGRAVAAMRALLPLSEGTQVIVLTHHRHLVALAGTLPEGSVHVCGLGALP